MTARCTLQNGGAAVAQDIHNTTALEIRCNRANGVGGGVLAQSYWYGEDAASTNFRSNYAQQCQAKASGGGSDCQDNGVHQYCGLWWASWLFEL